MPLPTVRVDTTHRALIDSTGTPFFWLGDTAWELFHRLDLEEAQHFLRTRARQGFNVIQAVALAEFDGLRTANRSGDHTLIDNDPTKPNEPYWQHVDAVIDAAAELGLYIGLLPTWGDKVLPLWGSGPAVFDTANAGVYATWLAQRYGARPNMLWILGGDQPAWIEPGGAWAGDRPAFNAMPIWRAMAEAIERETAGQALITYHPPGASSSSTWVHEEAWLDFNMLQSGHGSGRDTPVWEMVAHDLALTPLKPVLDGEPNYEDHPVDPWPTWDPANGYFRDDDVRKQSYRSVLAGACGVTYGHHAVWQFYDPAHNEPINHADRSWQNAITRPAAEQVRYLRALFERYPPATLAPAQELLPNNGSRGEHARAARQPEGGAVLFYMPSAAPVELSLDTLAAPYSGRWINPRDGSEQPAGHFDATTTQATPPASGDWVLVLEGA